MPFSGASYDPETLAILAAAFEAAWSELLARNVSSENLEGMRQILALRIMAAADLGERDYLRLKAAALHLVDG